MPALASWQNFYVLVGSAAGALIGLQFIVLALLVSLDGIRRSPEFGTIFAAPNIVHFASVLLFAASAVIPWPSARWFFVIDGLLACGGVVYTLGILRGLWRLTVYRPQMEDMVFHAWLPLAAYALPVAAVLLQELPAVGLSASGSQYPVAFFCLAASEIILLLTGIHNAWDNVAFHAFRE